MARERRFKGMGDPVLVPVVALILISIFFIVLIGAAEEEGVLRVYLIPKVLPSRERPTLSGEAPPSSGGGEEGERPPSPQLRKKGGDDRGGFLRVSGSFTTDMGYREGSPYPLGGGRLTLRGEELQEGRYTIGTSLSWYGWGHSPILNLENLYFAASGLTSSGRASVRFGRFTVHLPEAGVPTSSLDGVGIEWKRDGMGDCSEGYNLLFGEMEGNAVVGGRFSIIKGESPHGGRVAGEGHSFGAKEDFSGGGLEVSGSFLKALPSRSVLDTSVEDSQELTSCGISMKLPLSPQLRGGIDYTSFAGGGYGGTLWARWRDRGLTAWGSYTRMGGGLGGQDLMSEGFYASLTFPLSPHGRGYLLYRRLRDGYGRVEEGGDLGLTMPLHKGGRLSLRFPISGRGAAGASLTTPAFHVGLSLPTDGGDLTVSYGEGGDVRLGLRKRFDHQWSASIEGNPRGIGIGASFKGGDGHHWSGSLSFDGTYLSTKMEFSRPVAGEGRGSFVLHASPGGFYAGVRFTSQISWTMDAPPPAGEIGGRVFYASPLTLVSPQSTPAPYEEGHGGEVSRYREGEVGSTPARGILLCLDGERRAVTDEEGEYLFTGVEEGIHILSIEATSLSARYGPVNGWEMGVEVKEGETSRVDIPLIELASISGRIFIDGDGDFSWDAGEGISRPLLLTLEPGGRSSISSEGGNYHFSGLMPGTYRLRLEERSLGEGYRLRSTPERFLSLKPGETAEGVDFIVEEVRKPIVKRVF